MKVLFITNIPAPYRIDFYNELGKYVDLTVLFEAKGASDQGIEFNWNLDTICNFHAIFLSDGNIKEKKVDWSIFKYLKKNTYDKIVVTNYSYFTEMAALIYLKALRIPYYMETDGGIIRKENIIKKTYKKFLVSRAKGYFSPSKCSDEYLAYYGADRKKIYRYPFTSFKSSDILTTIVSDDVKRKIKDELGMESEKIITGIGQFIHRKGWDVLIEATTLMKNDADIYIIGGKPTDEYLKLIKKNKKNNVHFVPFQNNAVIKKYLCASDVFVLPTREDIWGLVINEAMGCGLPIITTNKCVSGLELVEDSVNGYIIDKDDSKALAEVCDRVLLSNRYDDMRNASLSKIRRYTIEEMAYSHIKVFNEEQQ